MNKRISLVLAKSLLTFGLVILPSFSAFANPSKAELSFHYRSNGSFTVDVKFDSPTTSRCIARHRSSLYYEDSVLGDEGVIRQSTISRVLKRGRTSTSLRAFRLPGAARKNGKDPIIAVQTRIVCAGEKDLNSNIEARYIVCGRGAKRVELKTFLAELKKELAFTS